MTAEEPHDTRSTQDDTQHSGKPQNVGDSQSDADPSWYSAGSKKRSLSRRQRIGVAVSSVVCAALIAVSVYALVPHGNDVADAGGAAQSVTASSTESAAVSSASKTTQAATAAGDGDGESAASTAAAGESGATASSDAAGSGESSSTAAEATGTAAGSVDAADSGSSENAAESGLVHVSVTVSSSAVGGSVSGSANPTFEQGATAYDALLATGLAVNSSNTGYGIYVSAIGGLGEKQHGGTSGWLYSVNGTTPGVSASSYVLSDGDVVEWFYTTG